ncbi:MAG: diguanylate cyclase [Oscillatoriales cyanobacterium SM2_1_8]|nr:diguanylate cyclase [Oscillatoriales cyanobacterium SM2_1_8]
MAETVSPDGYTVLLVGQGDRLADCGRLLTWLGCTWETAETIQRAIERMVALVPDLVLLDAEALVPNDPNLPLLQQSLQHRRLPWLFLVPRETGLATLCETLDIAQADCLEWPLRDLEAIARLSLHLKVRRLEQELAEQHQLLVQVTRQLDRLVELDGLKLAADREEFARQLRREWQRMMREAQPIALVLAAIDDFALYRERYGRQRSELCLRQVAAALARWVRRRPIPWPSTAKIPLPCCCRTPTKPAP